MDIAEEMASIPAEAFGIVQSDFGTPEWAVYMVQKKKGSCTFKEALESSRPAQKNPRKAMEAFEMAFEMGLIKLFYANKGQRGRPRYEFRIA